MEFRTAPNTRAPAMVRWTLPSVLCAFSFLADARAQGLRVAEPDRHFFGGQEIERTLLARNPNARAETLTCLWAASILSAPIQRGRASAKALAGQEAAMRIHLALPAVKRQAPMRLIVQGPTGPGDPFLLTQTYTIYPREADLPWRFLQDKRIAIVDPSNTVASVFAQLGVAPRRLECLQQASAFDGDLVIVGPGALKDPADWDRLLGALESRAAPLAALVLDQPAPPRKGQPQRFSFAENTTPPPAAEIAAPGHPLFREIAPGDLAAWHGDGAVANAPPLAPRSGNFRRLLLPARSGSARASGALILEIPLENGGRVVCSQLALIEKWRREPVCGILMNNLLQYATLKPAAPLRPGVVLCGPRESAALRNTARALFALPQAENDDQTDWSKFIAQEFPANDPAAVILDAASQSFVPPVPRPQKLIAQLKDYVKRGGVLIVLGLSPGAGINFEWAFGAAPQFEPFTGQAPSIPDPANPKLWGITLADWQALLGSPGGAPNEPPTPRYVLKGPPPDGRGTVLVEPGVLTALEFGDGKVLFLQADFAAASAGDVRLVLNQLATNLAVAIPLPPAEPDGETNGPNRNWQTLTASAAAQQQSNGGTFQ